MANKVENPEKYFIIITPFGEENDLGQVKCKLCEKKIFTKRGMALHLIYSHLEIVERDTFIRNQEQAGANQNEREDFD